MYAQCPECLSVFSFDARTLAQARGRLRCGHCGAGFDGLATLADWLPDAPFEEMEQHVPTLAPVPVELVVYRPRPQLEPEPVAAPESAVAVAVAAASDPTDFSSLVFTPRSARATRREPRAADRHLRRGSTHGALWASACGLLLLVLAAQAAWASRDLLLTRSPTDGWLRTGCAALHCTLPMVAAPARLRVLDSVVQTHPDAPGALLVSARVRNDAPFTQPYPVLTVTLSDADGQRVAMRRLLPREYLDDAAVRRRGMAPGASTVLVLEFADPGRNAAAFALGFQ